MDDEKNEEGGTNDVCGIGKEGAMMDFKDKTLTNKIKRYNEKSKQFSADAYHWFDILSQCNNLRIFN